ncbi:unnamed protein product [Kluyveromyces dobzhanskii CBS 2104]|uniref:WGS project CCBQ000000000 data, contig 00017 n=1 Tax=Kluyveromyces dobzhanskii CBS 2104 TaxID=1427455 RepID=A0A0A8L8M4_9SACH|nr:unnamed protein product [Kluyveromyces dobzhanskii CBS 2104]
MSQSAPVSFKVKTNFAWSGEKKDDLGFLEGDFIEVTKVAGDWYYGKLIRNKKRGYFPSNYVSVLEEKYNAYLPKKQQLDQPTSPQRFEKHATSSPEFRDRTQFSLRKSHTNDEITGYSQGSNFNKVSTSRGRNSIPQSYSTSNIGNSGGVLQNKYSFRLDISNQPPLPPIPKSPSTPLFNHISQVNGSPNGISQQGGPGNSYGRYSHTRYMEDSLASSEESFAIMSDFSATSAGSFARHNFARSFPDSTDRSIAIEQIDVSGNTVNPNMKESRLGDIFKKWLPKNTKEYALGTKDYPVLPNIQSLNISADNHDANNWMEAEAQLRRALTITSNERRERGMRATSKNVDLLLYPHSVVNKDLYSNEVLHTRQPGIIDEFLYGADFRRVDKSARQLFKEKLPVQLSVESYAQYSFPSQYFTPLEQLRGLFIFCTELFRLIDDNGKTDFNCSPANLEKVLERRYCTPYELTWLFKRMSAALNIKCEIVFGFLKTPNADNSTFKLNHCWLQVCFYEEWRFVDVILGNVTNPIHEYLDNKPAKKCESFYFLASPMNLINTHVPREYSKQHIVPELDLNIVLSLPVVFPSFFKNRLRLYRFSNGLCDLEDNEIFECTLRIPNDIEVFSNVVVNDENSLQYRTMNLSLVQVLSQNKRNTVIKAVLPPGASEGTLYIHSGIKGTQGSIENIHPISMIIPLTATGNVGNFEFVSRIPSEGVQRVEVYIKEPQNKLLSSKRKYKFEMIQSPSDGIIHQSMDKNLSRSMIITSPSGKRYKVIKNDPHLPFGTWSASIEVNETGKWSAMIISDAGSGWCEFAQWYCR